MVGGGFMARTYSLALSAVYGLAWPAAPEIRRVRLADVSRRLGESAAQAWGWDEVSDHWRAVTRADDVDLVLVLTPNDSHAEISIDALAQGKHVLCEKPLSNTLEGRGRWPGPRLAAAACTRSASCTASGRPWPSPGG
jgi:predicted dehydrogenase